MPLNFYSRRTKIVSKEKKKRKKELGSSFVYWDFVILSSTLCSLIRRVTHWFDIRYKMSSFFFSVGSGYTGFVYTELECK